MANNRLVIRRSISLSESTEALIRKLSNEGEFFSATVARLIEAGAAATESGKRVSHISSVARRHKVKEYKREPVETPEGSA